MRKQFRSIMQCMSIIFPDKKQLRALWLPVLTGLWKCARLLAVVVFVVATTAEAATYAYRNDVFAYDTPSGAATALAWHATGAAPACTQYPSGDDDWADVAFTGGFTFTFGGINYSSVRVYSNGMLAFGTDTSGYHRNYTNLALPISAAAMAYTGCPAGVPTNLMVVYWTDIVADPAGGGVASSAIKYELLGTAPNRRLVISWTNVVLYSTSTTYNFQVALYESTAGTNGNFRYQYTNGSSNGSSATVGVQLTTADYTQYSFNQSFIDTTAGTAIFWYPANQLAAKSAEYRFDESSWNGTAGEIRDTSGSVQNASRTTASVINIAGGKLCRGATFTSNTSNAIIDAVATPITPASIGSVDMWYKSSAAWNSADTVLFDATTVAARPFFLMKRATGALRFAVTDSAGTVLTAETSTAYTFAANTWKHIAVSWNFRPGNNQTLLQIMIDGVLVNTLTSTPYRTTSSGAIASFGTIFIGDNRTAGVTPAGGSPNGANGTIDEVYIYATEINATQASADFALTRATCTSLDHFHIVHNGQQVNCSGAVANVTIEAHDANHALFSLAGTVMNMSTSTVNTTWSSVATINPVINSGGGNGSYTFSNESSIILGLADSMFETVNINLNSGGITEKTGAATSCVAQDYTVGTTCDANLNFVQAGFIISSAANGIEAVIPTQVAGAVSSNYFLRAVQVTTTTAACQAALTGPNTVNFGYECNNPITCSASNLMTINGGAATVIARNNNGAVASYTPVPMTFDASGNAPFTFTFGDVGMAKLWVNKTINAVVVAGSSKNAFVTKPFGFTLSGIKRTSNGALNPGAVSAGGAMFVKAGEAFTATVTATSQSGAATPNYGKEIAPETVKLTATLVGGLGLTNLPALNNATAFGGFTNGVATGTTFNWPEVGIITIAPSVGLANYLSVGDVVGTASGNVGRFIPDHFSITAGASTPACSSLFTYFGQDGFSTAFTLTAQNLANATTQNYAGAFAKLGLATWAPYVFTSPGLPAGSVLAAGASAPTGAWISGSAAINAIHQVSRPTALTGQTSAVVNAAPSDSDGVTMTATQVAASTPLRFGRLRVPSAAGSQSRDLKLNVEAQYWNGTAFITNIDDSCTVTASNAFNFGNFRKTLVSTDAVILGAPLTMSMGKGNLTLQKPAAGHAGTYDLSLSLGASPIDTACLQAWTPSIAASVGANKGYLQGAWCTSGYGGVYGKDPSARITFGVYRGADNLIYQRENF